MEAGAPCQLYYSSDSSMPASHAAPNNMTQFDIRAGVHKVPTAILWQTNQCGCLQKPRLPALPPIPPTRLVDAEDAQCVTPV
jgi:hypothetical protein